MVAVDLALALGDTHEAVERSSASNSVSSPASSFAQAVLQSNPEDDEAEAPKAAATDDGLRTSLETVL